MSEQTLHAEKKSSLFKELVKFAIFAFLVVVPFRYFVAQPFIVNGASMDPTFYTGEYLIVDQLSYRTFDEPQRGSVVIFKYPEDHSKFFIKRIIGLPEETVQIKGSEVKIINENYPEGFTLDENYITHRKNDSLTRVLGSDEYFVMGDNRLHSSDSRMWGPVKEEEIIGRPIIRLFPLGRLELLPGDKNYSR